MADELAGAIERALRAVDAAKVPDDLREIAFSKALDSTLGIAKVDSVGRVRGENGDGGEGAGTPPVTDRAAKIARKCKVAPESVAKVFEEDGDELHIIASRSKFAPSMKEAMQQVALLTAAARQAAGLDEDATPLTVIRARCEEVGVLNEGNFSRHMAERREGVRIKGQERRRELKVSNPGFEAAGRLISSLAGGASE
jgi:hypothetical protein